MPVLSASLQVHARRLLACSTTSLFEADTSRVRDFSLAAAGLELDYAKQRLDRPARAALLALAAERGLAARIAGLFRGDTVNLSEQRPALHTALRNPGDLGACVNGVPVGPLVAATLDRVEAAVACLR